MPCNEICTPTDVAQILISQGMLEDVLDDTGFSHDEIRMCLEEITADAITHLTKSPEEAKRVAAYIDRKMAQAHGKTSGKGSMLSQVEKELQNGISHKAYRQGTLYDSTARDTQSHKGSTRLGPDNHPYVNHTTQKYPDGYRVSWDNPDQTGFHWTDEKVSKSDQETRHQLPPDAHRDNDPKE